MPIIDDITIGKPSPAAPTRKPLYAHVLLDRSGSMEITRDATIDAFNEYVNGLKVDPALDCNVSLSLFDGNANKGGVDIVQVFENVPTSLCPKLTRETYVPRGSTPLNDAIGQTVAQIAAMKRRDGENVAFVILTDGMENASVEYKTDAIKALLEACRKDRNWLVIFLAANQDAFAEGVAQRGTSANNTMGFAASNVGATMRSASRASAVYGAMGNAGDPGVSFTDEERKQAGGTT